MYGINTLCSSCTSKHRSAHIRVFYTRHWYALLLSMSVMWFMTPKRVLDIEENTWLHFQYMVVYSTRWTRVAASDISGMVFKWGGSKDRRLGPRKCKVLVCVCVHIYIYIYIYIYMLAHACVPVTMLICMSAHARCVHASGCMCCSCRCCSKHTTRFLLYQTWSQADKDIVVTDALKDKFLRNLHVSKGVFSKIVEAELIFHMSTY